MASKIFISYSRKDFDVVIAMRNEIQRRTGVLPLMDVFGIETGARFSAVIAEAIEGCELLVFVISHHSVNSPWTRKEVLYARENQKKIYPVVIDDAVLTLELDFLLSDLNRVDYRDEGQRENFFSDLKREITGSLDAPAEDEGGGHTTNSAQPCTTPEASHFVETRPNAATGNVDERVGVATSSDRYVFISYKSEEKELADRIKSFLEQHGFKWWMAPDSLNQVGTQDYSADIFSAIRKCTCLIFAVSPRSLSSKWVNREVTYANDKCGKPIIPFVVSAIPDEVQENNPLFIILAMEKQILNSTCTWDMKVLIPYLNKAFGSSGQIAGSLAGASKGATGQQVNYKLSNAKTKSDEGVEQATRLTVSTPARQRSGKLESADTGSRQVSIDCSNYHSTAGGRNGMATFQYIAQDGSGHEKRGTVVAGDRSGAIAAIRAQGLMPTALGEIK